ncbi:MAG: carboxypeptidase regulatory-like domain-containing protein [Deltaproteobacteria bacterium]|nr:carboxypeptidase regulatory-like domain-containing protein [Deltaproteobacteria bacterium]
MKQTILAITALSLILGVGIAGCGGSDDNNGQKTVTFKGTVEDFKAGTTLDGMTVKALNNDTGAELGIEATSDAEGNVTIAGLPDGKVGFLVVGTEPADGYIDTYQFNIDASAEDVSLIAVDKLTYQAAPALAGIQVKEHTAAVAGAFVWKNAKGVDEPVACGTVKVFVNDAENGEVRYFNDTGMPTSLDNRKNINPQNGYYLAGNVDPGKVTIKGYDPSGKEIGSVTFPAVGDSICISTLYVEEGHDTNPGGCQ